MLVWGQDSHKPTTHLVPDKFPTIQAAIDAASPGDEVVVRKGKYVESLSITKEIVLRGEDREGVVVQASTPTASALSLRNCKACQAQSVTFVGAQTDGSDNSAALVSLVATTGRITDCTIRNGASWGVDVREASPTISKCSITRNGSNGILVTGTSANPVITNNACNSNGINGIYFCAEAKGHAEGNECSDNTWNGIAIVGASTAPTIDKNRCSSNTVSGIYIGDGAAGILLGNDCRENRWHGISVVTQNSALQVSKNTCGANVRDGIYLGTGATSSVHDNIAASNANGIMIADATVAADIRGNVCAKNTYDGIRVPRQHASQIANNQLDGNNRLPSEYQIRQLLAARKYKELEDIATAIRTTRLRDDDGNWSLHYYYGYMVDATIDRNSEEARIRTKSLEDWCKARPKSATPHVALAMTYVAFAWQARGTKYIKDTPTNDIEEMASYVHRALDLLSTAADRDPGDPEIFSATIRAATLIGDKDLMAEALDRGMQAERCYYPLVQDYTTSLLPKWGGDLGELERFAERMGEATREYEGDTVYALIVCTLYLQTDIEKILAEYKLDMRRVLHGLAQACERFPKSEYFLTRHCLFACLCYQKELAQSLFKKLGNSRDTFIWKDDKNFDAWRNSAFGGKVWDKKPKWWPRDREF